MPAETELKLRIDPKDAARVGRLPWLAGVRAKPIQLGNLYYDCAERELAALGVALRHRVIGRRWFVTVKNRQSSVAGLAVRNEWEYPCEPGVLDFSGVADVALRQRLEQLRPRLQPLFSTDFKRRLWLFEPHADLAVEVAVDQGRIVSGDRSAPLCEIELELKRGEPHALYELALDIAGHLPVLPENCSKAERGHRLASAIADSPAGAPASPVVGDLSPVDAFVRLATACIDHLLANAEGVRRHDDPEYIHQARVAIRRLRALLKVFAPVLPSGFAADYNPAWRQLAALFGDARDRDVLVDETLADIARHFDGHDGIERFLEYAMKERARAREAARSAMLTREPGILVLRFLSDLGRLPPSPADADFNAFARDQLARRARRVRKDCQRVATMPIEELHRLRIQFKRLRYAVEFFEPLLKKNAAGRYLPQIKALQETLGRINDLERALAFEAKAPDAVRCELIEGWLMASQKAAIESLPEATRAFLAKRDPWA
jgi:inorganic triphosphatase YgiF